MTGNKNAKAKPHQVLIDSLLSDSLTPKTEREHAAVREIHRLRDDLRDYQQKMEYLQRRMSDTTRDERRERRERIAAAALQGVLAFHGHHLPIRRGAAMAVVYADALIEALDEEVA